MARIYQSTTESDVRATRALGSKLLGFPRPSVIPPTSRGVHNVDLVNPPAFGESKPGWDCFDVPVIPEWDEPPEPEDTDPPPPDRYTVDVAAYETELIAEDARPARDKRLTGPERGEIGTRLAATIEREPPAREAPMRARGRP